MAGDGSDAFEDDAEPTVTIGEYIEGIEAEELEADLVLGGDDGKECTYGGGYLKRQAVFSCLTCVPAGAAGVCTACSLACHDGHEVVELWTKRKFRCDCGNSKFGGHLCKLCPEKDPENPANSYNHNFKGSYCTCGRPYPDPEAKEQVEMIQCCICEDWFHEDHIGLNSIEEIPRDEEGEPLYEDFICHKCSPVCYFLKFYPDTIWASTKQNSSPQAVTTDSNVMEGPSGHANIEKPENGALVDHMSSEKNSVEDNSAKDIAAPEKANLDNNSGGNCKLGMDINIISAASADSEKKMPFFMCKGWREILCRCETCTNFYAQQGIAYLIDKEDSIEEYEKIAKQRRGGREAEGNFARKEALDKPNLPDGLDTQASKKPEGVQHLRTEMEKIPDVKRRKQGKKKKKKNKTDKLKYIESKNAIKAGKQRDLKKMLPLHSILKKYTRHTSVKMVKEKHGNSKGTEVIELCRKSVRRVKFSEANDVLGSKKQSCKLPQLQSLCELFSDAMASSSSSSTNMSSEGDKCITAESSSPHRPEKAFTKTKDANKNTDHEDSPELSNTELSSCLIDLNKALPEYTDLNYLYDPNSEVPNLEHTHDLYDETLNSDAQVLDGRENQKDLSFGSHGLECQPPATDLDRIRNSRSAGTLLHGEAIEVSETDIVSPPLSSRELAETHRDCSKTSVKDTRMKGTSPCALPDRTVHDSFQQHKNWFSTDLNHGASQLSTGGEFRSCQSQECNLSRSEKLHFHSELNVQQECNPAAGQTVRLMGKDLAVSKTRGECSAETAQKHTGPSIKDHLTAKVFLELPRQGQPFLSLQAQNFPNASVNSASTSRVSANSASTSQAHFGYRTPYNFNHPFPAANVFSADRSPYEDRFRDCSDSQPHRNVLLGCPPLPNHGSAAFHQNSLPPWRYYSDPFPSTRKEPPSAIFLPTTTRHATPSSVYHVNLPQPYGVHSASSSVRPHNSTSFTFSHPGRMVQEAYDSRRDVALPSRNTDNGKGRSVPDSSNTSSSDRYVQRSGPVKLTPGAKHILMPSDSTGDSNSLPVYSCVSFGSRSGNASASQNKGAELYKF